MNLPNKLTIMRLIMIPFMMFFYLASFIPFGIGKIVAIVLFIVAALTDLFDGKIARKYNMVTTLGKFMDPIADKCLTSIAFIMIAVDGTLPAPFGVIVVSIIIVREFIVTAFRSLAASKNVVLAADMWGKSKAMVQMIALPICFLLALLVEVSAPFVLTFIVSIFAYTLIGVATVLTVISGVHYLLENKNCFKD